MPIQSRSNKAVYDGGNFPGGYHAPPFLEGKKILLGKTGVPFRGEWKVRAAEFVPHKLPNLWRRPNVHVLRKRGQCLLKLLFHLLLQLQKPRFIPSHPVPLHAEQCAQDSAFHSPYPPKVLGVKLNLLPFM